MSKAHIETIFIVYPLQSASGRLACIRLTYHLYSSVVNVGSAETYVITRIADVVKAIY